MQGSDLRRLRKRLRMTTGQVAQALKVSQATVSRWETGERKIHPAFERLIRITLEEPSGFAPARAGSRMSRPGQDGRAGQKQSEPKGGGIP